MWRKNFFTTKYKTRKTLNVGFKQYTMVGLFNEDFDLKPGYHHGKKISMSGKTQVFTIEIVRT